MKSILLMAGSLLMASAVMAEEAPSAANGQKLFNESRCLECHGVEKFTSKDRKVNSLAGLESMVRRCDANLSTNWFDDQILDVVAYLNKAYYKFDTAVQQSSVEPESGSGVIDKVSKVEQTVIIADTNSD
ncbi:MAG: hypothetical protein ACPG51_15030 [Thiolinea sp.]